MFCAVTVPRTMLLQASEHLSGFNVQNLYLILSPILVACAFVIWLTCHLLATLLCTISCRHRST
jgi:hypothetical protein